MIFNTINLLVYLLVVILMLVNYFSKQPRPGEFTLNSILMKMALIIFAIWAALVGVVYTTHELVNFIYGFFS